VSSVLQRLLLLPLIILAMIALTLLVMPIIFSCAIVCLIWDDVLDRSAAMRPCPKCSRILGLDSLRIGREVHRIACVKYDREHPEAHLRVASHPAICVYCGAKLQRVGGKFIDERDIFVWIPRNATDDAGTTT
jgi:hypothetical protein